MTDRAAALAEKGDDVRLLDVLALGNFTVVDLAHPLHNQMPCSPTHPGFHLSLTHRHGDVKREGGLSGSHELIVMGGHVGTHIDAICHVAQDGLLHGGVPVSEAVIGGRFAVHGIEQVAPIVRRAVLFDIPRLKGVSRLEPGERIDAETLSAALPNTSLAPGDVALIRTGWSQLWKDTDAYVGASSGLPGIDAGAAEFLAAQRVCAVGSDTLTVERLSPASGLSDLPVHRLLIAGHGINLIEVMDLEALARTGAEEFVFVCAPLKMLGATGSPVRPIALVDQPR